MPNNDQEHKRLMKQDKDIEVAVARMIEDWDLSDLMRYVYDEQIHYFTYDADQNEIDELLAEHLT